MLIFNLFCVSSAQLQEESELRVCNRKLRDGRGCPESSGLLRQILYWWEMFNCQLEQFNPRSECIDSEVSQQCRDAPGGTNSSQTTVVLEWIASAVSSAQRRFDRRRIEVAEVGAAKRTNVVRTVDCNSLVLSLLVWFLTVAWHKGRVADLHLRMQAQDIGTCEFLLSEPLRLIVVVNTLFYKLF